MVFPIRKSVRFILRLFGEFLGQTVATVGLMVILGAAYTQFMIGLTIGMSLLVLGIVLSRTL